MHIPLYIVKADCSPHDQLRLLDAWEDWGVPRTQQWKWVIELFGADHINDLADYLAYETLNSKEDQLDLPFGPSLENTESPSHSIAHPQSR